MQTDLQDDASSQLFQIHYRVKHGQAVYVQFPKFNVIKRLQFLQLDNDHVWSRKINILQEMNKTQIQQLNNDKDSEYQNIEYKYFVADYQDETKNRRIIKKDNKNHEQDTETNYSIKKSEIKDKESKILNKCDRDQPQIKSRTTEGLVIICPTLVFDVQQTKNVEEGQAVYIVDCHENMSEWKDDDYLKAIKMERHRRPGQKDLWSARYSIPLKQLKERKGRLSFIFVQSYYYRRLSKSWNVLLDQQKLANTKPEQVLKYLKDRGIDYLLTVNDVANDGLPKMQQVIINDMQRPINTQFVYHAVDSDIRYDLILQVYIVSTKFDKKKMYQSKSKPKLWQLTLPLTQKQLENLDFYYEVNTINDVLYLSQPSVVNNFESISKTKVRISPKRNLSMQNLGPRISNPQVHHNYHWSDDWGPRYNGQYIYPKHYQNYYHNTCHHNSTTHYHKVQCLYEPSNWEPYIYCNNQKVKIPEYENIQRRRRYLPPIQTTIHENFDHHHHHHETMTTTTNSTKHINTVKINYPTTPTTISTGFSFKDSSNLCDSFQQYTSNISQNSQINETVINYVDNIKKVQSEVCGTKTTIQNIFGFTTDQLNTLNVKDIFRKPKINLNLVSTSKIIQVKNDMSKVCKKLKEKHPQLNQKFEQIHNLRHNAEQQSGKTIKNNINILHIRILTDVKRWGYSEFKQDEYGVKIVSIIKEYVDLSLLADSQIIQCCFQMNQHINKQKYTRNVRHPGCQISIQHTVTILYDLYFKNICVHENEQILSLNLFKLLKDIVDMDFSYFKNFGLKHNLQLSYDVKQACLMRTLITYGIIYSIGLQLFPDYFSQFQHECQELKPFCSMNSASFNSYTLKDIRDKYQIQNGEKFDKIDNNSVLIEKKQQQIYDFLKKNVESSDQSTKMLAMLQFQFNTDEIEKQLQRSNKRAVQISIAQHNEQDFQNNLQQADRKTGKDKFVKIHGMKGHAYVQALNKL